MGQSVFLAGSIEFHKKPARSTRLIQADVLYVRWLNRTGLLTGSWSNRPVWAGFITLDRIGLANSEIMKPSAKPPTFWIELAGSSIGPNEIGCWMKLFKTNVSCTQMLSSNWARFSSSTPAQAVNAFPNQLALPWVWPIKSRMIPNSPKYPFYPTFHQKVSNVSHTYTQLPSVHKKWLEWWWLQISPCMRPCRLCQQWPLGGSRGLKSGNSVCGSDVARVGSITTPSSILISLLLTFPDLLSATASMVSLASNPNFLRWASSLPPTITASGCVSWFSKISFSPPAYLERMDHQKPKWVAKL